jgi:hypothetical protein
MEVNIATRILMIIVHKMGFVERKQFQEHHKKIVSQKMNMTIMERTRSMRLHFGLPLQFWADVVNTTVYLINKVLILW